MTSFSDFGIEKYPPIHRWGLSGPAQSGKTTFLASNVEPGVLVFDWDQNFTSSYPLLAARFPNWDKRLPLASRPDGLGDMIGDPTLIRDTIAEHDARTVGKQTNLYKTLVFDSATRLFRPLSQAAHVKNRIQVRTKSEGNLADRMQEKAAAMKILTDVVTFGHHIFFVWHTGTGRDGGGDPEDKTSISPLELERLSASLNVQLQFAQKAGAFEVKVTMARAHNGVEANTNFTIRDGPNNYWRGGLARLERYIYSNFQNDEDQALDYAFEMLGNMPEMETKLAEEFGRILGLVKKVGGNTYNENVMWVDYIDNQGPGLLQPFREASLAELKAALVGKHDFYQEEKAVEFVFGDCCPVMPFVGTDAYLAALTAYGDARELNNNKPRTHAHVIAKRAAQAALSKQT